eukprot:CAMPEP_0174854334 /NCGR_PEP_ID=MMETSP1114-20130205/30849_1 /TAXON_ID=312471 /ORGANISM="Neobodo designis, Strain CCAP 1951/1" /LENGTH=281 /DNA_ID=CAMNT_0016089019 /DNA_START=66 /DNA_END=911 /DNA_ORIENTATION=+
MAAPTTTLLREYTTLLKDKGGVDSSAPLGAVTKDDVLIVVDMQNDFVPGGAFGVAEGDQAVPVITTLMAEAHAAGARIFATRDYHPVDHCSFNTHGGPFPPHCVQNADGSKFVTAIGEAIVATKAGVVFKGFSKDVDSFGGFAYADEDIGKRVTCNAGASHCGTGWTGGFVLFSSTAATDVNAPPDVMAVLSKKSLADAVGAVAGRVIVVGLALDFCVVDTAINAARAGHRAVIAVDASRAAHIPGLGQHGSGFLTDPAEFAERVKAHHVQLATSSPPASA